MKHVSALLSSTVILHPTPIAAVLPDEKPPVVLWKPSLSAKIDPQYHFSKEDLASVYECFGCGNGFVLHTGIVYRTKKAMYNGQPFSGYGTFCSGECLLFMIPIEAMAYA